LSVPRWSRRCFRLPKYFAINDPGLFLVGGASGSNRVA